MKTLVLCVDRDDDFGAKAGVETPLIGRRRNLEAAVALGLADPEDADTNAVFAAVHLYDEEVKERGAESVEVATVVGHARGGVAGDRRLSEQLDQVLSEVRPDQVIMVSDGADDEQVLPLIQARAKLVHVHRSIVKQAPRLEGFYYVITRILDEEKQARRFVLPLAVLFLFWGIAFLFGIQSIAWGITLAFVGFWLLVHVFKWEKAMGRFLSDLGKGLKSGTLGRLATLAMLVLLGVGAVQAYQKLRAVRGAADTLPVELTPLLEALFFLQVFLPFVITALLVRTAGRWFDAWLRRGRAGLGSWIAVFMLVAVGFLGTVAVDVAIDYLQNAPLGGLLTPDRYLQLIAGLAILIGGLIVIRYLRGFLGPRERVPT